MTIDGWPALARLAQEGDVSARRELLIGLYGAVRKHVLAMVGAGAIADDAVQESMIAVDRGLAKFRGDAHPRTWALSITTRITQRLRKREARYVIVDEVHEMADHGDQTSSAAELALLQRGLARLTAPKRDAFVLMGLQEMSATEAGKALGTFANTAASRYRHACAELERYFSAGNIDEPVPSWTTKQVGHA